MLQNLTRPPSVMVRSAANEGFGERAIMITLIHQVAEKFKR